MTEAEHQGNPLSTILNRLKFQMSCNSKITHFAKFLVIILIASSFSTNPTKAENLSEPILFVPAGTKIKVMVKSPIYLDSMHIGDEIELGITENISIDGQTCLTTRDSITGYVAEIYQRDIRRSGAGIIFNTLHLKDDKRVGITASALTHGGVITVTRVDLTTVRIDSASIVTNQCISRFMAKKNRAIALYAGDEFRLELAENLRIPQTSINSN